MLVGVRLGSVTLNRLFSYGLYDDDEGRNDRQLWTFNVETGIWTSKECVFVKSEGKRCMLNYNA
jgi:hypothetical protein